MVFNGTSTAQQVIVCAGQYERIGKLAQAVEDNKREAMHKILVTTVGVNVNCANHASPGKFVGPNQNLPHFESLNFECSTALAVIRPSTTALSNFGALHNKK